MGIKDIELSHAVFLNADTLILLWKIVAAGLLLVYVYIDHTADRFSGPDHCRRGKHHLFILSGKKREELSTRRTSF